MKKIIVKYYLNFSKATNPTILVSVSWNGNRIRTTINESIEESCWNQEKQTVLKLPNRMELNRRLSQLRNDIESLYYEQYAIGVIPTAKEMMERIRNKIIPVTKTESVIKNERLSFIDYFKLFIDNTTSGQRLTNQGQPMKRGTYKTYVTTMNHLVQFSNEEKFDLTFDKMNKEFFSKFINYLIKKGFSTNYNGTHIKILKTFLNYANDMDWTNVKDYTKDFKVSNKETTIVALSTEDLQKIEVYEPVTNKLANVRICFLLEIYTGLRYSDMANLKPENINLIDKTIRLNTIKTEDPLVIPLGTKAVNIIEGLETNKLPIYSNQKYNEYIKELCKLAGIDTPQQKVKYIGNKRIEETVPKYTLITSHTARRTFVTLALKKGHLPEVVMKISGHKDRRSFQRYVRIDGEEAVNQMRNVFD